MAIKEIPLKYKNSANIEFEIIKKLTHKNPNIIKFYELVETKEAYYLVFELAPDGSLHDLIVKEGKLSESKARFYMK